MDAGRLELHNLIIAVYASYISGNVQVICPTSNIPYPRNETKVSICYYYFSIYLSKTGFLRFYSVYNYFGFSRTSIQFHYHSVCYRYALDMTVLPQELMATLPKEGMLINLLIKNEG